MATYSDGISSKLGKPAIIKYTITKIEMILNKNLAMIFSFNGILLVRPTIDDINLFIKNIPIPIIIK